MDDPILTPRGVGRYVTAADVADLKPSITESDARLFIDGAGAGSIRSNPGECSTGLGPSKKEDASP